jgi:hypothetical protein
MLVSASAFSDSAVLPCSEIAEGAPQARKASWQRAWHAVFFAPISFTVCSSWPMPSPPPTMSTAGSAGCRPSRRRSAPFFARPCARHVLSVCALIQ